MAEKLIDPWGSGLLEDYEKIVKDFGLEAFNPKMFPEPNRLMRRGVVFAGRDLARVADAIKGRKKFYALTGIMPSAEKIHFGTKMVIENMAYFQKHGAKTVVAIADLESAAVRGVSLAEARKRALEFQIPAYIALGLDPKKTLFYFQSENREVTRVAFEAAQKITFNEFRSTYGSPEPSRIMSALTQIGDILYPQHEERMAGIVPVGIDQEPHIRLSRDFVTRTQSTLKFTQVSSIYHKYTPSLDGGLKMSKSKPESCIELPEDAKTACAKIKHALTGGRDTLEEHRRLGAVIEKDMVFELLKQHLVEDDRELQEIYEEYKGGRMTSGELKQIACEKITVFMNGLQEGIDDARSLVKSKELNFIS
ncbi:TPA: tryptophan--tRNA ligase [Candidatus Micrarchaeota archaeon]|nr:tryptophan--tRNA ligase [Candidatus Micrarchaeota archaeon]